MDCVRRINLKTSCNNRKDLLQFCLQEQQQYVAIGWSYVYERNKDAFADYKEFYYAAEKSIRDENKRVNHALNSFWYVKEGDLFWTRDLQGIYWICRAEGVARPHLDEEKDIGAVVPVKALKFGLEIPGQIKASFNRPNGGIIEEIRDPLMIDYSKYVFNELSGENIYEDINKAEGNIVENLPDFDLEELVISYLQIKENYYVLSNSIANKSTTVAVECELMSRDTCNPTKAVVQVKARQKIDDDSFYTSYVEKGYRVFLYDGGREVDNPPNGIQYISQKNLTQFYDEYKAILPESITMWEKLFE